MSLIDAHCHLANLNDLLPVPPLLEETIKHGITRFLSSALRKAEVHYHLCHPKPEVLFSAGIHPNFGDCDLELGEIEELCRGKKIWAIGEIGLDRGNPDLDWQEQILAQQLELAVEYGLPVVVHLVGHLQLAYRTLKRYPLKYLVHGYAGKMEGFKLLSRLDTVFTISSRILRPDKLELLEAMVENGAFLFETDITQYYVKEGEANPLLRLLDVFKRTQELCMVSAEHLIYKQNKAFTHLTGTSP